MSTTESASTEIESTDGRVNGGAVFDVTGAIAALGVGDGGVAADRSAAGTGGVEDPDPAGRRRARALRTRIEAAAFEARLPLPAHPDNGDDDRYENRIASYTKGLPHNELGEVDPAAYTALLEALASGDPTAFASIPLGGARKLIHPQGSLELELFGPDSHHLAMPPAPAFASAETAGEAVELYWMALTRDVPFTAWASDPGVAAAAAELSTLSNFRGPKADGRVTPDTIYRLDMPGCLTGPYVSQFLWRDIPIGTLNLTQLNRVVVPNIDYVIRPADWLAVQRGGPSGANTFDTTPRFIRSGRDLGQYVHVDVAFQAFWNATLALLRMGAALDAANPYLASTNQQGNSVFGPTHIASLVGAAAARAVKAVWFQKWGVHRRLRPEALGGRAHNHITGAANYPLHEELLGSQALAQTFSKNGAYFLPQSFPEGSPTHPSYGANHAAISGVCATMLKAFFNESFVIPSPVVANSDGTALTPWTGASLTAGGELNKLAMNIALGRNFAGVHYRADSYQALLLGEEVAIRMLREDKLTYSETFAGFSLTKFDGTTIAV